MSDTPYVYLRSESNLYTVGFYEPDGKWQPESDHRSPEDAAARVHFLNGGTECGQHDRDAKILAEAQEGMLLHLKAAFHCLRSYEFGNSATEPAKDVADRIKHVLAQNGVVVQG